MRPDKDDIDEFVNWIAGNTEDVYIIPNNSEDPSWRSGVRQMVDVRELAKTIFLCRLWDESAVRRLFAEQGILL